ncbi:cytochrome c oxidase assembly factor 7 homolog [Leptopilina heterotoma]|uniref:cytochrome c oxidase assembly factor 7 homolog n=1 Tax=Leptopilina heterotoma TaxID=63436 RepID=UPI001CA8C650|nr:cytochrome c oxidase assembly factor 7 homolog [Leptopilina heterotoma]
MAGYNLKNKEEVKEYLKKLHIEYNFGCYSEKNPEVCHLLGDYNEAIFKNYKKSAELFKKNCDTFNFARSCNKYARYNTTGVGVDGKDLKTAYQYMKKGCELGDGESCLYTGLMIMSSDDIGVEKSEVFQEGLDNMKKACHEMKEYRACSELGKFYINGVENLIKKDEKYASKLFVIGCEKGDSSACFTLAQMYNRGIGVVKSEKMAHKFRRKASEIEQEKKKNVGLQFHQGIN